MNKEHCPYCGHKLKDDREQQHMIDKVFEQAEKLRAISTAMRHERRDDWENS